MNYFKHESSYVDDGAIIGSGTKIWHFSHIQKAKIGERCIFGQNVNVADGVIIGNNVKVQNNVSIYTGTVIEDDVFLGPSCVLTNVTNPRSQINRHSLYEKTLIRRGATIGANATIVCGVTLGRYCFIAAGSVVTKDVPDYALMVGNPARQKGWMSRHGHILRSPGDRRGSLLIVDGLSSDPPSTIHHPPSTMNHEPSTINHQPSTILVCPESGYHYELSTIHHQPSTINQLRCLDLDEEAPLPPELTQGTKTYDELKR
jgi:UDP-2-acetamido-3-amino-2,3-dideoxy-glucuronate N-acetyltransferase